MLIFSRQRASNIDPNLRQQRLGAFLEPIREAWQDEAFRQTSSSFDGFCRLLGLENVGSYMQAKQAYKFADWSEVILDEEGKAVQEEMTRKFQARETISMTSRPSYLTRNTDAATSRHKDYVGSFHRQA